MIVANSKHWNKDNNKKEEKTAIKNEWFEMLMATY